MGVRTFVGHEAGDDGRQEQAVLFDSVTGLAFGPIFDSEVACEDFQEWHANKYGVDLRTLSEPTLLKRYNEWYAQTQVTP